MTGIRPRARRADLLTEEVEDELLVYDEKRDVACRLNRTAAVVWRGSDGTRSPAELVALLAAEPEIAALADEDLVMVTLDHLHAQGLIASGYEEREESEARLNRRRFIRKVGAVGAAAAALPVVQSIIAPAPAAALSGGGGDYSYSYSTYYAVSDLRLKRSIRTLTGSR